MESPEITLHLPREKWSKESVVKFIDSCLKAKGVPMFKTKFIFPFKVDTARGVMAVCWGGVPEIEPLSRVFYDIPKEDLELLKRRVGAWEFILKKYSPQILERHYKELSELI
jgi:hypothetical protein